jgi:hypothetical protein
MSGKDVDELCSVLVACTDAVLSALSVVHRDDQYAMEKIDELIKGLWTLVKDVPQAGAAVERVKGDVK